ncbi:MAG TPA: hypothetical protein VGP08_20535 [Pyrinomonadaceae bacterium]|nr:hypothetical protein [Pyrinomonadaceae bacterium]
MIPALLFFCAFALAVVVTTGALLDRMKVRRSRRVMAWAFVSLLLPFSLLALFVILISLSWSGC